MLKIKVNKFKLPSCIDVVGCSVQNILSCLEDNYGSLREDVLFEIRVILNELILNAVKHGNNEESDKYVKVVVGIFADDKVMLLVEDEGIGYNYKEVQEKNINSMLDIRFCNMEETGRGIMLVLNLCDRIKFSRRGNRITVIKKLYHP